jgi:hypothetical protein
MKVRAVIEDYVKRHGMTKKQLAAKARMHPQVITDLCAERIVAGVRRARRLSAATNGEITFQDLRPDLLDIMG